MSRIRRFREQNPHLFDDSDSDQSEENLSESEDSSNKKFGFDFKPIFEEHSPRRGRPNRSGRNQNIETIPCLDHFSKAMACSECMKTNFIPKK